MELQQNQKKSSFVKNSLIIIAAVIIACCIVATTLLYVKHDKYKNAMELMESGNYSSAALIFSEIDNYKNSSDLKRESYYMAGNESLDRGDLLDARICFYLSEGYMDSQNLYQEADRLEKIQGTYVSNKYINTTYGSGFYKKTTVVIRGNRWHLIDDHNTDAEEGTPINVNEDYELSFSLTSTAFAKFNDSLTEITGYKPQYPYVYIKESDSTYVPKQVKVVAPYIGMPIEELKNSSWGKPKRINYTTTKYGTSEQWVYSDDRYVYVDDGIVSAIQGER